jgi:prolyl 4-hydroxylase
LIADRVEYLSVPDFLTADECSSAIEIARTASTAAEGAKNGALHELAEAHHLRLLELDAKLCDLLGLPLGSGVQLQTLYSEAALPRATFGDSVTGHRCAVAIYLNRFDRPGEVRLGRSGCVLRLRSGTALIAKRETLCSCESRVGLEKLPTHLGYDAVLIKSFDEGVLPLPLTDKSSALPLSVCRVPHDLFDALRTFHNNHAANAAEEHVPGYVESNQPLASQLLQLPEHMQRDVHSSLQPIVEQWSRCALTPTFVYGIRRYLRGTTLKMHRDREGTHVFGASLNVAQEVEDPWPLCIEDGCGQIREIVLRPGEMILFESERLLHGRPEPLRGNFYAGVFAHFRPRVQNPSIPQITSIGDPLCASSH